MTRFTNATLILLTALFVAGCSTDYEVATGYDREAAESSTEQAPGQAADSAASSSDAPETLPASSPGGEEARLSPAEEPGVEPSARPLAAPSPPGPAPGMVLPPSSAPPAPSQPTPSQPSEPRRVTVKLSTGVALAQTLPTGTAMGFSVDYTFMGGMPAPSPYLWVIVPSRGQPVKQPVQLKLRGTLQGFCLQLRPEHGPFKSHIEDTSGNRLSRSIDMQ